LTQAEAMAESAEVNKLKKTLEKKYVHLFPHSHTDEGWLAKSDDFFTGKDTSIFSGSVQDILDTTMLELLIDKNRTFCYAETKYFYMWWEKQDAAMKEKVRGLVKRGQLDLLSGGWAAPDEATTTYDQIIDNMQIGQQFLQREFEHHPKVSWQVDAFGLSTGYARLARDFGFDAMFFSRVDIAEKIEMRAQKKKTEVWRPHEENFGDQKDILAFNSDQGAVLGSYCWPAGFWADTSYLIDVPIILNRNDPGYNFEGKVRAFYEGTVQQFEQERTNHQFRPFGCDMAFIEAKINYKIADNLIATWNRLGFNETVELLYSTPTKYIKEIAKENKKWNTTSEAWPVRRDDTFPYAQNPNQYWNGFYSSRPHIKKNIRDATTSFHSANRLLAQQIVRKDLDDAEKHKLLQYQWNTLDALGNLMHHDAITGTSTTDVMGDFNDRARLTRTRSLQMNTKFLAERLEQHHGIHVKPEELSGSLDYFQTWTNLSSPYSHFNDLMFTVQNPSA